MAEGYLPAHGLSKSKCMTLSRLVSAKSHSEIQTANWGPVSEYLQVAIEATRAINYNLE